MSEPIEWLADGTPYSPRFGDRYRSEGGGLAQSREVFLHGCGLPQAWGGQSQWCLLETGFGLGLNFLVTWQAWKLDPERPLLLHFVSTEAYPCSAADVLRAAAAHPELLPLADQLQAQLWGLLPGVHRLVFERGQVLLTVCIGPSRTALRDFSVTADSIYLDGFSPAKNPEMWDIHTLKAVARCCRRGTRIASWTVARHVLDGLAQCGFQVQKTAGLPPKRDNLQGRYDPPWEPTRPRVAVHSAVKPSSCTVVGAGLAGAAVAASLARRGWQVTVIDAQDGPAEGASGLPAGLLAPHISPDDSLLSRLSRSGVRATLQQAQALLREGSDWRATGVLERRLNGQAGLPVDWPQAGREWSEAASAQQLASAGLQPEAAPGCWQYRAGWIKPAQLVRALLAHPAIHWRGQTQVASLQQDPATQEWAVLDRDGELVTRSTMVVLAAGYASRLLVRGSLPLQAIRGQVSWGLLAEGLKDEPAFPRTPVNGHGSFIPDMAAEEGRAWLAGASFERDNEDTLARLSDAQENLARLTTLLPATAARLQPGFQDGSVRDWVGIRCASPDRLPIVGAPDPVGQPGLWVSTAMGSRGLSFAILCAELLAAQLHGEPPPLNQRMAQALAPQRLRGKLK